MSHSTSADGTLNSPTSESQSQSQTQTKFVPSEFFTVKGTEFPDLEVPMRAIKISSGLQTVSGLKSLPVYDAAGPI